MTYRLGVDVGGTFTDLLLVNEETGDLSRVKISSTPSDPSKGVLAGIQRILEQNRVLPNNISHLMHGTTVATNAGRVKGHAWVCSRHRVSSRSCTWRALKPQVHWPDGLS